MNRRTFNVLVLAFALVMFGISVHRHGWVSTLVYMLWFWGAYLGCWALLYLNERVLDWRERSQS